MNAHQESHDIWYVDSGCSNHMTGNYESFITLDENIKSQITFGDGRKQNIQGKSVIVVKAKDNSTRKIYDVFYVLGLTQNLLSVGQLT